ncbi:MAG: MATE family efflux transporter [Clostridia bacterium]|nr:MATE family efflux transporter [Clostridia bacterium]MBQ7051558.1 MATE family efflux transporter [Clostridia bacterium]
MKKNVTDMTHGAIMPHLIRFGMPVLLGMLFQRIYNFVDVFIVGHYLGDEALAAVSIAGSGMYLLMSLMMGLTTGVSIVIAQYYGAGEEGKVRETFVSSIYVAAGVTALITAAGMLGAKGLLGILQTSDALIADAHTYLLIIFAGCCGTMLYNWISAVMRSLGNSIVPLAALIVSSLLNIALDILLIAVIPLGVAGAALATVLSQALSGLLCLFYAFRILPMLRIRRKDMRMNPQIARQILTYGIPTGLQMSIISISDMALQAKINTYETALIVAYGIAAKVEFLGWQLAEAIGTSLGTFVGQNVGAGDYRRVRQGVRCAYVIHFACYGVFCPVVWLLAEPIMGLFTQSPASVAYGVEYMRIFSFFFLIGGTMTIYHNILRASGDVKMTLVMGMSEVVTRISFTFLFTHLMGYWGLWWVSPITWVCAVVIGAVRYYSGKWEEIARRNAIAAK